MFNIGPAELIVIMAVALLFFGPKKLPEIGRSVGNAMREFRRASNDFMDAFHGATGDQDPAPPPVKTIEYPTAPELASGSNFETLPYGSDFYTADGGTDGDEAAPIAANREGSSFYDEPDAGYAPAAEDDGSPYAVATDPTEADEDVPERKS